ncbi:3-phosphoserine/phosphohydroxythreonine transaminase [Paenibacillus cremeus]|uniref:Phosphoserine aminotransferase n=1 Tax=Paenibacillus cremeus TaxID=2163881 RepID=A0A559KI70_9BACL|nr:3-phosphoserine/phosphohydroxythreonine transaminase [Paenibacillus cremeus]TVY11816.1 3-phosphoserine/phosphohydroxythreonine transaminase [Paenibacillus cremeus]
MSMVRTYNFNPGPAALPLEVLEQAKEELVEYEGRGMSITEMSHRSPVYERVHEETQELLRELLQLPSTYRVLLMGGGASAQFALLPMNFLTPDRAGAYVLTGSFSEKAYEEARTVGTAVAVASTKLQQWACLPQPEDIVVPPDAAYVHLTTNNTIEGSQFTAFPETGEVPLIGDMTSDLLSRDIELSPFSMMYAGAQKNLGPAGVTVVLLREELLEQASEQIPAILRYKTFAANNSLYNTPPVHAVYMMRLVLQWAKRQGGVAALEQRNREKARRIYEVIDGSGGFYQGVIETPYRSMMNITWRMASEELEQRFVAESEQHGFDGLAGHRSVGGLRASAYNAVPLAACEALADFMRAFQERHG